VFADTGNVYSLGFVCWPFASVFSASEREVDLKIMPFFRVFIDTHITRGAQRRVDDEAPTVGKRFAGAIAAAQQVLPAVIAHFKIS
jgi:hypothetical protein